MSVKCDRREGVWGPIPVFAVSRTGSGAWIIRGPPGDPYLPAVTAVKVIGEDALEWMDFRCRSDCSIPDSHASPPIG